MVSDFYFSLHVTGIASTVPDNTLVNSLYYKELFFNKK